MSDTTIRLDSAVRDKLRALADEDADVRREADGRTYHALVRFRAVTEPA